MRMVWGDLYPSVEWPQIERWAAHLYQLDEPGCDWWKLSEPAKELWRSIARAALAEFRRRLRIVTSPHDERMDSLREGIGEPEPYCDAITCG